MNYTYLGEGDSMIDTPEINNGGPTTSLVMIGLVNTVAGLILRIILTIYQCHRV